MHVEGVLANNDYILNGCYIEITSNCNLRCIHCYNESGELRDQISVEAFKNVLGCYDKVVRNQATSSWHLHCWNQLTELFFQFLCNIRIHLCSQLEISLRSG